MAEGDKKKKEDGGRTQYIDRKMKEGTAKNVLMGTSRLLDKAGFRQDKTYEGKSDEELATKKRAGGKVKAKEGKWIQSAIKKPGALREQLGIKGKKPIPAKMLDRATKAPGKLGQRARLAKTLRGMK